MTTRFHNLSIAFALAAALALPALPEDAFGSQNETNAVETKGATAAEAANTVSDIRIDNK